jgi:hypothetical protein
VDLLSITPADIHGNVVCIVVVVAFSKFVWLYPAADYQATTLALGLFKFFCNYGLYDEIWSDPGSNLTSDVVAQLNRWFGIRHRFSLVDRHESNGVEGSNKQILRHLRALVMDERVISRWSEDSILPLIQYILNSEIQSEASDQHTPFELMFGSDSATYNILPSIFLSDSDSQHKFLSQLNENLRLLTAISRDYQRVLVAERENKGVQNFYQPGDLILALRSEEGVRPNKLAAKWTGPHKVVAQYKNDVEAKHVVDGRISKFHVDRVKIFAGTVEEAFKVAQHDKDQYEIEEILAYRGDPFQRSSMQFEVKFADQEILWISWSQDLFQAVQYGEYVESVPALMPLLYTAAVGKSNVAKLNKMPITEVTAGEKVFVDLRSWGELWYDAQTYLPDMYHTQYLVEGEYVAFTEKKCKANLVCSLVSTAPYLVDHYFVKAYGSIKQFPSEKAVLVDASFLKRYPQLAKQLDE